MSSFRFPCPFFRCPNTATTPPIPAAVAAAAVGLGTGLAIALTWTNPPSLTDRKNRCTRPSPAWAVLSLESMASEASVEPRTGTAFPAAIDGGRQLLGVGLRRKSVFGLKNIDVYAYGIYVNSADVNNLREKYGTFSASQLKDNKGFYSDVLDEDIGITVRLQIVYGRLSIRSVRDAFEESVGSRLQKFGQSDHKELLRSFTAIFRDECKIPKGCVIDLHRERDHNLHIKIDGKEVGCIQSKLLCKSVFDLYVGDDSFDRKAKEDYDAALVSLLRNEHAVANLN